MGKRIPADKAKPGDWLWWPNQHIALYSGDGKMIHSPRSGKKVEEDKIWGNPIYIRFDA
jgi:cell wall-associated NlpC family hydrolase